MYLESIKIKMEDDMPVLIDTVEVAKKSTNKVEFDFDKKEDVFKKVLSKKERREKSKAEALAASTSLGDDIEIPEDDEEEMDGEEEENITSMAEFERKANDANANRKFNFPQLSGEKLMVNQILIYNSQLT